MFTTVKGEGLIFFKVYPNTHHPTLLDFLWPYDKRKDWLFDLPVLWKVSVSVIDLSAQKLP